MLQLNLALCPCKQAASFNLHSGFRYKVRAAGYLRSSKFTLTCLLTGRGALDLVSSPMITLHHSCQRAALLGRGAVHDSWPTETKERCVRGTKFSIEELALFSIHELELGANFLNVWFSHNASPALWSSLRENKWLEEMYACSTAVGPK